MEVIARQPARSSSPCSRRSGPNLTRESFADALFRLEPTPDRLTASSLSWGQHGRWPDIEGDDWEGIDNITRIWWDPDAVGPDELRKEGTGLWRFVDGGKRYLAGEWPEEDFPAFDEEGTSTIYEDTARQRGPAGLRAARRRAAAVAMPTT